MPRPTRATASGDAGTTLRCRRCCFGPLCLPGGVQPAEVALLDGVVEARRTLAAGEVLVQADAPFRALYAVRSGSLKSQVRCGERVQVLAFHFPGELAGWDGIGHGRHRVEVVALEPSSVCLIRYHRLMGLADRIPRLYRRLLALMAGATQCDWTVAVAGPGGDAEQRVLAFLLNLAERRLAAGLAVDEVRLGMSRDDIASYLGLAPETVSRAMVRVSRSGLVRIHRRRVRFGDLEALRAAVLSGCPELAAAE